jgi:flagellar motor switch protein FliM
MLEADEIEAIRAAIQQAHAPAVAPAGGGGYAGLGPQPAATSVALISDNRTAERARPNGLRLASRWLRAIEKQLAYSSGIRINLNVASVETIDGATARTQTQAAWLGGITVVDDLAMIAVTGPIVEQIVARMLGDSSEKVPAGDRPLSALSRRLFTMSGQGIASALIEAWAEELGVTCKPSPPEAAEPWRHALSDGETVVVITLNCASPTGSFRIIARPDVLAGPDAAADVSALPGHAVEAVLGNVPVDVRVELGRATMTMAELGELELGAVIPLDRLIDDAVPILCAGVVKAHGKPLAARGGIAVEVVALEPSAEKL